MTLRGQAAIVGIGEFKPRLHSEGATTLGMLAEVGVMAATDAGVELAEIDGLVTELFSEAPFMGGCTVSEYLGMRPTFLEQVDLGGATSGVMVARAAAAIAAGQCETVLIVTAARRERRTPATTPRPSPKDRTPQGEFDLPYAATGAWGFAMYAAAYLRRSNVLPEHLGKVVVSARRSGCRNPAAIHYGSPVTLDDYLASPVVMDPLRQMDGTVSCAGASALVVTTAERANRFPHPPVYILGTGEHHTHSSPSFGISFDTIGLELAARKAFAMAGLGPNDMDFACIYDAFSTLVPASLEAAGFIEQGAGGAFLESNDFDLDARLPVNPHGGQLAFGHTGVPAGMSLITAAAREVMGRAGEHQLRKRSLAFVNGCGGQMATHVALVLGDRAA